MAEAAQRLLDVWPDAPCLALRHKDEGDGEIPAQVLVDYSMERLRKQKMLCGQLQVTRFLLELLQETDIASWEETSPELLSREVQEVKQKWKELKSECQDKLKAVEETIPQLLEKIQLLHDKKAQLEESLQRYHNQKAMVEHKAKEKQHLLQETSQNHQRVVQKCQDQIQELKDDVWTLEQSADSWIQSVKRESTSFGLLRTLRGVTLVSAGENELVLDLETEVAPLRVNLLWTSEEEFQVETEPTIPDLPPDLRRGTTSHITPLILELQCWYGSHGHLFRELQDLQERFAIDWLPPERSLLFLKGSRTYRLHVDPGYPMSGGVRLVSVKGTDPSHVTENLKPPMENPSLSDWLNYLHTNSSQ